MNINYDNANENDAYGISYVSAHSWKETYMGLLPKEYLEDRVKNINDKVEKTKLFIKNYPGRYIVAKDNNKVIGILSYTFPKDKECGYLEALYVLKKYQGYGIGKELFKKAVIDFKKKGFKKMKLLCMTGNSAINFYKKYLGVIKETILYPINNVGNVKADMIYFEDLDAVIAEINRN